MPASSKKQQRYFGYLLSNPDERKKKGISKKDAEEIVTMHEKSYRLARAKYNPFAVGGSENIHDFE